MQHVFETSSVCVPGGSLATLQLEVQKPSK